METAINSKTAVQIGPPGDERRGERRHPCSDTIWWKAEARTPFCQGWLIERSARSLAFLTRGPIAVPVGRELHLSSSTPTDIDFRVEVAATVRVQHVHADLFLVVAEAPHA